MNKDGAEELLHQATIDFAEIFKMRPLQSVAENNDLFSVQNEVKSEVADGKITKNKKPVSYQWNKTQQEQLF